jgi:hypothetical protein
MKRKHVFYIPDEVVDLVGFFGCVENVEHEFNIEINVKLRKGA